MIKELDATATIDFVSRYDNDEPKTVFQIGIITEAEMKYIRRSCFRQAITGYDRKGKAKFGVPDVDAEKMMDLYLAFGLKGWQHFLAADGSEIQFRTVTNELPAGQRLQAVDPALIAKLHPDIKLDIFLAVQKANTLTEGRSISERIAEIEAELDKPPMAEGIDDMNVRELQEELSDLKTQLAECDEKNSAKPSQSS